MADTALQRDRSSPPVDDFSQQVQEILAHYHDAFEPSHPLASMEITEGIKDIPEDVPEVWILGSSGNSTGLAGSLGLGYAFAGFSNPTSARAGLDAHRRSFPPTLFGPDRHRNMLALNIVAADDEKTAHRLTWLARAMHGRLSTGKAAVTPTLADAEKELSQQAKEESSTFDGHTIPRQLSGTADTLREQLAGVEGSEDRPEANA